MPSYQTLLRNDAKSKGDGSLKPLKPLTKQLEVSRISSSKAIALTVYRSNSKISEIKSINLDFTTIYSLNMSLLLKRKTRTPTTKQSKIYLSSIA
jgi:hypothetical protein